jgi:hypothetical protein
MEAEKVGRCRKSRNKKTSANFDSGGTEMATQLEMARRGKLTPEMRQVALKERAHNTRGSSGRHTQRFRGHTSQCETP